MKIRHLITLAAAIASAIPASSQDAAGNAPKHLVASPTWTNTNGRATQAEFVCLIGNNLTLTRGGREFIVSVDDLSPESRVLSMRLTDQAAAPGIGRNVLAFCIARTGRKVGDGQCTSLAVQALAAAGARGMGRDAPNRGDYVWGRQVALIEAGRRGVKGLISLADVKAGDIIQFRDAGFSGATPTGGTYWMSAAHHTAVVVTVDPVNSTLVVYHQNWGKKIVRKDVMCLPDLRSGWLRIYRPVAAK